MAGSATTAETEQPIKAGEYPEGSVRLDWAVVLLSLWYLGGLFMDGWAHNNVSGVESFFTPWHAVFYSGFTILVIFYGGHLVRNMSRGYAWQYALPRGYYLTVVGVVIFTLGAASDAIWHEFFGGEEAIEILLSPTHLLLTAGMSLIITGPIRATSYRTRGRAVSGWRELGPMVLSVLFLLSLFTFMTQYAYFLTEPGLTTAGRFAGFDAFARQEISLSSTMLQSGLVMGMLLLVMRRWPLPVGSLTLILALNFLAMGIMRAKLTALPAAVLAGIIGDLLLIWWKPSAARPGAFHLWAFLVPTMLYGFFMLTIAQTTHVWWSVHVAAGLPVLAGAAGFLVSYLVLPPAGLKPE